MSPKRKRTTSVLPVLDTIVMDAAPQGEPQSPRSRVAENFGQLQIQDAPSCSHASKRRQLPNRNGISTAIYTSSSPNDDDGDLVVDSAIAMATPPKDLSPVNEMQGVFEIGETPGAYKSFSTRLPSSPPMSPSPSPSPLNLDGCHASNDGSNEENVTLTLSPSRRRGRSAPTPRYAHHGRIGQASESHGNRRSVSSGCDMEMEGLPAPPQGRRFSKPSTVPITAPPPPTPLTSPGEEPVTGPLIANATAKMFSLPTLPSRQQSISPFSPSKKRKSPPPSTAAAPSSPTNIVPVLSTFESTVSSASSPQRSSASDDASMTWQESEITGHLWDPLQNKDDDGEGINGIGFRPSAAVEWKRREGRKRQVSEWKAREAKEDRKRRFDRRKKRGSGGRSSLAGGGGSGQVGMVDLLGANNKSDEGNATPPAHGPDEKRARVRFADLS
ncbi:hypothetical protein AAFC00_006657 [Neodothiora populina]|uniref:Uncharacterized protein n=1 Tax=Neodothiora populina TaxID=2781224 RepID=A0ABR3PAR0_9PEZI